MTTWQVQRAKSHFSELMEKAVSEGPQTITKHGTEAAVLVSVEEYRRLTGEKPNLIAVLLGGPKFDDDEMPDFSRDKSLDRDISYMFEEE